MKAFQIDGPGQIHLIETPIPTLKPDETLVRVAYAGLCATDLAILSGDMSLIRNGSIRYPVRFGHEWSGIVEQVGSAVTQFKPGDRVISETAVACGVCEACKNKQWSKCGSIRSLGTIHCWEGAFADYMLMPERHLYHVPDSISMQEAALIEPSCIALAGIKKLHIGPGKTVLVIGTGAIGLAAVALAKYFGADKVILCGRKDGKLEVGGTMGADVCVNTTKASMEQTVAVETGGKGVDVILETSGNVRLIPEVLRMAAEGAYIGLIGFYEKEVPSFPIDEIVMKSLNVRGVMGEFGMPGELLEILATGKLNLKSLISHVIPFEQTAYVMEHADEYAESKIKILAEVAGE